MLPPSIHSRPPLTNGELDVADGDGLRSSLLFSLDEHRDRVAAAEAQRGDAESAAAALERMQQRHQHPCSAGADRDGRVRSLRHGRSRDRAAARAAHAGQHLHRERFVDFEQIDVVERASGFGDDPADGFDGRGEQVVRLAAGCGRRDDSRERPPPDRAAADSEPTTTAAAPSLIIDELPAVTVPSARNDGVSCASCSRSVSLRGPSSCETSNSSDPRRTGTGTISAANAPASAAAIARR